MIRSLLMRRTRHAGVFMLVILLIEFLDELAFGTREAAWPLIRTDLNLTYAQIGILIGIPGVVASFIEPFFGVWTNMGYRKPLIVGGGIMLGLSLIAFGLSGDYLTLLIASFVSYPASGAFVALAQTALMDKDPERHEQNMARWTLAGSLGMVGAPLLLGISVAVLIGWRGQFIIIGVITLIAALITSRLPLPPVRPEEDEDDGAGFIHHVGRAFAKLRDRNLVRWYLLLNFSDLMLDVLFGFLALYFVDVVGADPAIGGIAVMVWTGVGLLGDIAIIPILERVRGLTYLRFSSTVNLILFPLFLLIPGLIPKLILIGLIGIFNAGTYSILSAQVYTALPGESGTTIVLANIFGLLGAAFPIAVGAAAGAFGLDAAMWLLLAGPIALLIGIPRNRGENRL